MAEGKMDDFFDSWKTLAKSEEDNESDTLRKTFPEHLKNDRDRVLEIIDEMMASIYIRAREESAKYFEQYKEFLGTEFETKLRPVIRWREGRPVELFWVSKIVTEKVATQKDIQTYGKKGKSENGVLNRIVIRNNQAIRVREIFKFISRGRSLFYPKKIFDKEPGWVQLEGGRLEDCFRNFRQQMEYLKTIRSTVNKLQGLDTKFFAESVYANEFAQAETTEEKNQEENEE